MDSGMYNTTEIGIRESSIAAEHWRVLRHAVENQQGSDPRHGDVYRALEYFTRVNRLLAWNCPVLTAYCGRAAPPSRGIGSISEVEG
jgi:hypothetical protein